MQWSVRAVAWVRSTRSEPLDDGWDLESSSIELDGAVPDESLSGLEEFSHVVVVYVFDRALDAPPAPFSRRPRGNPELPSVGIFAQRAKDRPNRLGVSVCRLLEVAPRALRVEGLDAIDGTPVVDLKPDVAEFGARGEHRQPGWMDQLVAGYFDGHGDRGSR